MQTIKGVSIRQDRFMKTLQDARNGLSKEQLAARLYNDKVLSGKVTETKPTEAPKAPTASKFGGLIVK